MNRQGLGRFGVAPCTILRIPTTSASGLTICPECGHPVDQSKGSHEVAFPEIVGGVDPVDVGDVLVTHGWACNQHSYDLVLPLRIGSVDDTRIVLPGWVGVKVRFADGSVRPIPTPAKEIVSVDRSSTSSVEEVEGQ